MNKKDQEYMLRAIELAKKGRGKVSPNPMVGAVIVKDERIIGEGFHEKYGDLHAERNAFKNLSESAEGATLYVTLEPCCHYGKTPPCTEAIIDNKIKKVVIGSRDPNPLVSGKGVEILKEAGIEVETDFLRDECDLINPIFFHYITHKKPYVALKYAMTLDGKIATRTGASKWITDEEARTFSHGLRNQYSAILVGIGTVLEDDPLLNTRMVEGRNPLRIILDSNLRIPIDSKIVQTAHEIPTIVAFAQEFPEKEKELKARGVELLKLPDENKQVDLKRLIEKLGEKNIDSLLIEGGGQVHEAALRNGIVDHIYTFIAPKIFGGKEAKTPVEGKGVDVPAEAYLFTNMKTTQLGNDLLLEYDLKKDVEDVHRNH